MKCYYMPASTHWEKYEKPLPGSDGKDDEEKPKDSKLTLLISKD